ncbi:LysR family transcriptional regulator [Pseudooceanicola nanhaiensis]|uniref:LysR family transcriptional regulator n=1 Tax=Pseudooceanicola nanhaiensis TaxID=375761 RepID=UPI001CD4AB40|nr:LysR family transcriptional regulator [Pseudooceanicola nanhaiensis]MCA0920876.1 LysR family transcriptional regulator [Pseudooceanicola nanhaiensis]
MTPFLNIRHLAFFRALAESGSFTRAAEICGVSQPGLSVAIRELEDELGVKLFDRSTRAVTLTPKGRELFPVIEVALVNAARIEDDIRDVVASKRQVLRLAAVPSISASVLPRALAQLDRSEPALRMELIDVESRVMEDYVREERADAGIGAGHYDPEVFGMIPLFGDPLSLVMPASHPWASRDSVQWAELEGQPYALYNDVSEAYRSAERTMLAHGLRFAPISTTNYHQTLMGQVLSGCAFGIVPRIATVRLLPPDLVCLPLSEPEVARRYTLIYKRDRRLQKRFVANMNRLARQLSYSQQG